MNIRELKLYIYENKYVEQILESIGCHHVKYHASNGYWTCANATGDNNNAIVIYNDEPLFCTNYTRQMINTSRATDIIDLVSYTKSLDFVSTIKFMCNEIGVDYYHDFNEDIPMSFQILKMIDEMNTGDVKNVDQPLTPISENILDYYKPYVNSLLPSRVSIDQLLCFPDPFIPLNGFSSSKHICSFILASLSNISMLKKS